MLMRTAAEWLTPVRASGMAAYLTASVACAATVVRAADKRVVRLAALLCALDLALLFDIAADWRWKLYVRLRSDAVSHHWYNQRSGPQIIALLFVGVVLVAAAIWLGTRFASVRGARLAIFGGLLSVGCWLTEVISFHWTDAVLYRSAGPLMIVSFVWILACLMTAAGVLSAKIKAGDNL
jgi:hypothetical protein